MRVWSLGGADPLEESRAAHSSIPAWRIPWTEEPGGLQSMGLQRVRHAEVIKLPPPPPKCWQHWTLLIIHWHLEPFLLSLPGDLPSVSVSLNGVLQGSSYYAPLSLIVKALHLFPWLWGFPHSSVGKESACNAGDPCSIPGLGRSTGKGIDYPLQYSWASLVTQLVKWIHLQCRDPGPIPGLGWSPGEGTGYPLQYSGLENVKEV